MGLRYSQPIFKDFNIVQQPMSELQQTQQSETDLKSEWLQQLSGINLAQQTFLDKKVELEFGQSLQLSYLQDEVIPTILSQKIFQREEQRIEWLVSILVKLYGSFSLQQSSTVIKFSDSHIEFETISLRELADSCCSYLTTLVIFPETFDLNNVQENPLDIGRNNMSKLVDSLYSLMFTNKNDGALELYLNYLDKKADPEESTKVIQLIMRRVVLNIQFNLQNQDQLVSAIILLDKLTDYPNILKILMGDSLAFYHQIMKTGRDFQFRSVFGRILSLSTYIKDTHEWRGVFQPTEKYVSDNRVPIIRDRIKNILDPMAKIIQKICKVPINQEKILHILSNILQLNIHKTKIFNLALQGTCSSPGLISNLLYILLRLSEQFLQNYKVTSKLIDVKLISYLKKHPLISKLYQHCEVLNAQLTPLQEPEEFPVLSDYETSIWLLTQKALQYHVPTMVEYLKYQDEIYKQYKDPRELNQNSVLQNLLATKSAYDVSILDPTMINLILKLLAFSSQVAMNYIDLSNYDNDEEQKQPIQSKEDIIVNYPYGVLPLTFLEDMPSIIQLYLHSNLSEIQQNIDEIQTIIEYSTIVLANRQLLLNPHIRVKLIQVIAQLLPTKQQQNSKIKTYIIFSQSKLLGQFLIQALIDAFIDSEKTGTLSQFFDKFRYRFIFCRIFNYLIQSFGNIYSSSLERISHKDKNTFLEFANLYLNDMIFLLDECLAYMKKLKKLEDEIDEEAQRLQNEPFNAFALSFNQSQREAHYRNYKSILQTYKNYLEEYYKNIQVISESEPRVFMTDEIREKLVNNMNYTVEQLNGANAIQYKTRAMKDVNFQPQFIISNIIELYTIYSDNSKFLEQIVKDERSFSISLFEETIKELCSSNSISIEKLDRFRQMMKKLESMLDKKQQFEEVIQSSTVPDEFLDPILGEIMQDPVMLPTSRVIIDRITIKKHLLNDKSDPFNRHPLTYDMLLEMPELKTRITQFIEQKKKEQKPIKVKDKDIVQSQEESKEQNKNS